MKGHSNGLISLFQMIAMAKIGTQKTALTVHLRHDGEEGAIF